MALAIRDIPFTREDLSEWLAEYEGDLDGLRDYLQEKLGEHGDATVDTTGNDSRGNETPLIDLIMDDLESYG